ncbi:zinc finger protein 559-like, partial [Spodoptera litura]|uniref:Zinc finger protein 559-like n=1 Tax=Spodoptera litura TaxID=69820 RepID=A0A9J7ER91_SPOLT
LSPPDLRSSPPDPRPAPPDPRLRQSPLPYSALPEVLVSVPAHLRLHVTEHLAPHAEFLLWFAEDVLAALDMPFLTPQNISDCNDYTCHKCGTTFDEPNPLKVHMFLSCAIYEPEHFWRRVVARLRPTEYSAAGLAPELAPAALEALATEWGRARGGHVCVYCGKLYSRRYGLKIHLRTHTGYRPLRCRHCRRPFGDPSNLNKHERLHAARGRAPAPGPAACPAMGPTMGPYGCTQCGRALARRRDLERHMRTHTRDTLSDTH